MVKKQEQLFHLIKSLSKEEKRHFKLTVNKYSHGNSNNYVRLFDFIEKQSVYDEAAIREHFCNETFSKQLTVTKNYLTKQIIKSLQNLHYDDSADLEALVLHHQIAVLFKKGQYEMCRGLVKKGIDLCSKNELLLEWIGFLKWEIALINKTDIEAYKTSLGDYLVQTSRLMEWYDITTQGYHLTNQLTISFLNLPTFGFDNKHYFNYINRIQHLIQSTSFQELPVKTRYNLLFPLAQAYQSVLDYERAYEVFYQIYTFLKDEYQEKELVEEYISTLSGLIFASGAVNKLAIRDEALNQLNQVPEINTHISFKKAENLFFHRLFSETFSSPSNNDIIGLDFVGHFIDGFNEFLSDVHYIIIYYYTAYLKLQEGDLVSALKFLRKTDSHSKKELLPNQKLAISIMEIVIFFEQGKLELVESRLRSLYRKMIKISEVKPYILSFIQHFNQVIAVDANTGKSQEIFRNYLNELLALPEKEQIAIFIHFDLIAWLQSKLEGGSFKTKIQENGLRLFFSNLPKTQD